LGEPDTVKSIKAADLVAFAKKYYTAPNVVLVGTGPVKHDELVSLASKALSALPTAKPLHIGVVDYVGSEIRIRDDTSHSIHAAFTFEGVGRADEHYWTFLLLKTLIGSWSRDGRSGIYQSSRLAETVALEKLASNFRAFYHPYNTTGLFGVYTETTTDKIDDLTYEIFNEFQKLAMYIGEPELFRAKNQLKSDLLSQLENPLKAVCDLGNHVIASGRPLSVSEQFKRIEDIELSDLQTLLDTYLTDIDPVVVGYGPLENLPDYNLMRNWTYWNRW